MEWYSECTLVEITHSNALHLVSYFIHSFMQSSKVKLSICPFTIHLFFCSTNICCWSWKFLNNHREKKIFYNIAHILEWNFYFPNSVSVSVSLHLSLPLQLINFELIYVLHRGNCQENRKESFSFAFIDLHYKKR